MKHINILQPIRVITLTALLIAVNIKAPAQTDFSVKLNHASVQGTSTLHDWESQITELSGKGAFLVKNNIITTIKNLELKIPVESIKSKEGKIMDNKTYDAFLYEKNPFITLTFSTTVVKTDPTKQVAMSAPGFLTMAEATRPVTLTVKGAVLANGDLQVFVSQKLKMTDFDMVPPKAVLGTIHVGDEITVSFDVILEKVKKQ
ncbi:MAG: YceI family protein [Bacteroidota bacterium]